MLNRLAMISAGALLIGGCASMGIGGTSDEEDVRQRATAKWQTVLDGEFDKTYEYLSPGSRERKTRSQFMREKLRSKVAIREAEILEVNCDAAGRCETLTEIGYTAAVGLPGAQQMAGESKIKETWLQSDDEWYVVQER